MGFEGVPGCALVGLTYRDETAKELSRETSPVDDFSGRARKWTIRASAPPRASQALVICRVNKELVPGVAPAAAKIWFEAPEIRDLSSALQELQKNWDEFAKTDPLWAILSDPAKRGGGWDLVEFFKTGEEEIARVMKRVESLPIKLARGRALDFGCGVGRLTQALCLYFNECWGVDIAPAMLARARELNPYPDRCHFLLNESPDLKIFPDHQFDFIYAALVLQHMKPEFSRIYIQEFVRVLAHDGLLIFQLPERRQDRAYSLRGSRVPSRPLTEFRAEITLTSHPGQLLAGQAVTLRVKVKNTSKIVWPAGTASAGLLQVELGNHWRDAEGNLLVNDDARASLPANVNPGEELELPLTITPPRKPGRYILELDMVQEWVAWFRDKGSPTCRVHLDIAPGDGFSPRMEMYGVGKEVVLDWIRTSGGLVVEVEADESAGEGWLGYRYSVTKR